MEAVDLSRRLGDFSQVAQEVLRDVPEVTEQQIRHWIVNPFLVSLGWDPHDKHQVYLDFTGKGGDGPVDYALFNADGDPRLFLDVRERTANVTDIGTTAEQAKAAKVPLVLLTNGREFSLWHVSKDEPPAPLAVLSLGELADNSESLLGLTVEYRLSDTGIEQLRRSAIRLAVLQMLEENAEKTFDALVGWVRGQVAPGALDDTTEEAIRDATMLWLTEEHLMLPGFAPTDGKRPHELRSTTAKDWEPYPKGPAGTFQYKYDTAKILDLRQGAKEVREQLRNQGLRTPSATSFGGFYHSLRSRAGLGAAK
jgi:Type I restriction enzyme R protein N terminus (HSDR_N)